MSHGRMFCPILYCPSEFGKDQTFTRGFELAKHIKEHHPVPAQRICSSCNNAFDHGPAECEFHRHNLSSAPCSDCLAMAQTRLLINTRFHTRPCPRCMILRNSPILKPDSELPKAIPHTAKYTEKIQSSRPRTPEPEKQLLRQRPRRPRAQSLPSELPDQRHQCPPCRVTLDKHQQWLKRLKHAPNCYSARIRQNYLRYEGEINGTDDDLDWDDYSETAADFDDYDGFYD